MIVAPQPEPVAVGAQVLRAGGNAVDACVAAAHVQGVVDPLMCGLGGFGLAQLAGVGVSPTVYDGLGRVPTGAAADMWEADLLGATSDGFGFVVRDFANETGPAAALVPGTPRLLADLHAAHGRLPWADLVAPAIEIARGGWIIRPHVATVFTQDERRYGRMDFVEKLAQTADGARLYLTPDGSPKRLGDRVVNPDLGDALAVLAADPYALSTGELAGVVADAVIRDGGLLSRPDLADFRVGVSDPLHSTYRGWGVSVPAPPGGGTYLLQGLALIEHLLGDPPALGHNDAAHLQLLAEVMKTALVDKERFAGDPDFPGDEPPQDVLDHDRLAAQADAIRSGRRVRIERLRGDLSGERADERGGGAPESRTRRTSARSTPTG